MHWMPGRIQIAAVATILVVSGLAASSYSTATLEAPASIQQLIAGNQRYVKGKPALKDYTKDRAANSESQHPYAIVVACADSRLSPEILFDESLGKLFVVRVAGNVMDPVVLGSVEYAAEHLHVKLVLVLGHESCGAVKAALAGGEFSPNLTNLVDRIKPAVVIARSKHLGEQETLDAAIKENVLLQCALMLKQSSVLAELAHKGELQIMGGVYNLHSGKIEVFTPAH